MSTHNIGFYEDLIKIIFQVSHSIKYVPNLLDSFCQFSMKHKLWCSLAILYFGMCMAQ